MERPENSWNYCLIFRHEGKGSRKQAEKQERDYIEGFQNFLSEILIKKTRETNFVNGKPIIKSLIPITKVCSVAQLEE